MSEYFHSTNSPYYAVATALPLLICYEVLVVATQTPYWAIRNAADVWMRTFFLAFEIKPQHLSFLMIGAMIIALPFARRYAQGVELRPRYFVMILGESLGYSLLLGIVLRLVLSNLLLSIGGSDIGLLQNLALSIGAGLFEEFFFRVLLLGVLLWFIKHLIPNENFGGILSVLLAAFLFSGSHYIGNMADSFTWYSFLYRWLAGVAFTALYYFRGFAVTSCTHALYDIRVLL
ncbi:MAG TPA: CPBP family intramembrane metalloprotease [Deltaproteobacteria bacterium]|jgi:hypothetical protein|nr:CPBP family intramembrane metalloprotease [SAR324 cluster bacterium]HIF70084.1 CPBP family intramembrane metalloprotease [Candidatus Lambdaproteobacteria bacterium]HIL15253.1 CPBP family intramembrane metalloprotease [Deltaproteobacteria bacterium]|tara:strand:+ start:3498 stop:4193 length:696 start_codon:yes stop_codon:yes gene_type:complete